MEPIIRINPSFDSKLTKTLFELEEIRYSAVNGTTPAWIFFDLKEIIHTIESLASARIEGNHTTLAEAIDHAIDHKAKDDQLKEISNITKALNFVDAYFKKNNKISLSLIREIHKIVISDLVRDGSQNPGEFRQINVKISGSDLVTPSPTEVPALMKELIEYIDKEDSKNYDIIKIAIAHHRFTAIHPFDNGNGRVARILTYAMLIQKSFIDNSNRLLNPSAIFCVDRNKYYKFLAKADQQTEQGVEEWSTYVAQGILEEITKINKLLDKTFIVNNILLPAIKSVLDDNLINQKEAEILKIAMDKDVFQAGDVYHLFGDGESNRIKASRFLSKMREKELIMIKPKTRNKYVMRFYNRTLLHSVMFQLNQAGLLPIMIQ